MSICLKRTLFRQCFYCGRRAEDVIINNKIKNDVMYRIYAIENSPICRERQLIFQTYTKYS